MYVICIFVSGFTLDKESNTIAILCEDVTVVFAFDTREQLIQWQAKIAINLGEGIYKELTDLIVKRTSNTFLTSWRNENHS